MARIKFGVLITAARGTIGGLTFTANKSGPYAKVWSKGANPKTPKQTEQRRIMSQQSADWKGLSPANQANWDTWAALPAQEKTDSLGQAYYVSGFNWYTALSTNLVNMGRTAIATAPAAVQPTAPTVSTANVYSTGAGTSQITYPASEFGPTYDLVLLTNLAPSPGRRAAAGAAAAVVMRQAPGASPALFQTELENTFGNIIAEYMATLFVFRQSQEGYRSAPTTTVVEVA